ncbi:histidine kinase [Streptomyces sodiiphilus]|uniref:histidine kinase n=1 Tax=Streptomyces sodiiphilus TaxID=226217 RepID=A0ABN2NSN0_9ACTN
MDGSAGAGVRGSGLEGRLQRWVLPGELLATDGRRPVRRTARDWLVDSLLFLWAVFLWLVMLEQVPGHLPVWLRAVDAPAGAVSCLALWLRRRFPAGLALAMVPVGGLVNSSVGALMVVIANLGLRVPWRPALAVLGLHLLGAVPYMVLYTLPYEGGWPTAAFIVAFYLVFFSWGGAMRARRQLVVRLRQDAERERAEHVRRLADTRRAEREAIAREMHDVLAHRISLLSVHAGALAYRTGDAAGSAAPLSGAEVHRSAQIIRDNAHQALEELREVLTVLRGTGGELGSARPQVALADIAGLVEEARRSGQPVELEERCAAGAGGGPRPQVQRTAYRVVQEGLTNARKHAPGARVTVSVTGEPGTGLTVRVANPLPVGVTQAEIPGAGAGLTGLEERVGLDGGELEHGSTDGTFLLLARLPWARGRVGTGPGGGGTGGVK